MKRRIKIFSFLMLLFVIAWEAKANPIDERTARLVGLKFMNANAEVPLRTIDDLQLVAIYSISHGDDAFYIFNTPNGFVIVAADDCATPILGYSDEGQFDIENIPIQMQDYLQDFVEQIEYGIENHLEADENIARQWQLVTATGRLNENRDGKSVEPLITALWSQNCYYNAMCPEDPDGPCGHVLTGCVATAMGMILHYWGYPMHGTGSHTYTPMPYPTTQYPEQSVNFEETTYDWANMPNQLTEASSQEEITAVATLLWHCGVAVNTNYGPYGSGTDEHFLALIDYFDYSDDMHWEARQDDESWVALLKADLDYGRPVFYTGYRWTNSGHAFVCDGYDMNDRFHFNWGWSNSSNGYFALNATMVFVYNNEAIFNIHPNSGTTYQVTASAIPSDGGSVSGTGIYDIGSVCTLTATANEGYTFTNWTENGNVVSTDATYSFTVTGNRTLVANFAQTFHFSTAGNWSEPSNWQENALPSQNDIVFIDAPCQLDTVVKVVDLTISDGHSLTILSDKTLTVTGQLFNTDTTALVIKDGAQLVNASANVAATMEKDVTAFGSENPDGWYTIASPMNEMPIAGSNFLTPSYDLYRFNETNLTNEEWENYKASLADFTTFENGRGYLYANDNAFSPAFTGTLNNSEVTYSLTCTNRPDDSFSGFNLIGNPFPHEIYKGAGGAIDNANLASGYYTLTNEGTWQVHTFDDAIQPGQGILVKATAPTVLTISKTNETADSETGEAKGKTNRLRISVKGDNGQDQTYVYFGQGVGLDKKNDLNGQAPSLWVRANGNDYAIAHVDSQVESLELCFNGKQDGEFTLSVVAGNTKFKSLQLTDRATGTTVDLLKQPNYSFHATGQEPRARFCIEFRMME